MKVCHLTSVHATFDTRIFLKECVSLARAGYDVSLVSNHARDERVAGVQLVAVKRAGTGRAHRMLVYTWKILFAALKTRSEIYHFHDPELFFAGVVLKLLGKKVIFDIHENIREQITVKDWLPFRDAVSALYRVVDALSAKLFYLILAENSYDPVYARFKPRRAIVLNMPDLEFLEPYIATDRSRNGCELFYVGDVTNQRGMDVTVEALAELKRRKVEFFFHCVGPYTEGLAAELEAKRAYQDVKRSVRMYGRLALDKAFEISKRCRIGLCLVKPLPNYTNSYSTKVFEYMAVRLPVVAGECGILESVVEENKCGLCVDPYDPIAVADSIERIIRNGGEAHAMGLNGRKAVLEKYSWALEKAKMIEFYREVAAER